MPVPAENRLTFQKKCGMIAFTENERAPAGRVPAVAVAPTSLYANVAQSVEQLIRKNQVCDPKSEYANVAQSVEQLIRNQQVVCSSHIISSRKQRRSNDFRCFRNF